MNTKDFCFWLHGFLSSRGAVVEPAPFLDRDALLQVWARLNRAIMTEMESNQPPSTETTPSSELETYKYLKGQKGTQNDS
jgi:hypothetical protein